MIIRDGSLGRDLAPVTDEVGEFLTEFDVDEPLNVGDQVGLPDGSAVTVIAIRDQICLQELTWTQVVTVGDR